MDKEEILKKLKDDSIKEIYAFMYGSPFIHSHHMDGKLVWEIENIVTIPKDKLQLDLENKCFIYVWGWPGPDYNVYYFDDYRKTWVFKDCELDTSNNIYEYLDD